MTAPKPQQITSKKDSENSAGARRSGIRVL